MNAWEWKATMGPYARQASGSLGIPAGVILTQWALETGHGTSRLFLENHNAGGIKFVGQAEAQGAVDDFADYGSLASFTADYIRVLSMEGYGYPAVRAAGSPAAAIRALQQSGYAEEGYTGLPNLYYQDFADVDAGGPSLPASDQVAAALSTAETDKPWVYLTVIALLVAVGLLALGGGEG